MSKKNEVRQMSSRYCPKLDDNVIVMTSSDDNGFEKRTCLSSHLCREDDRAECGHDSGAGAANTQQQFHM
ncbi:MAG: hypothetical protein KH382_00455 [Clostridiales bacterium]|nr:hypothetical protein [Clostridiales bacterium]